MSTLQKCIDKWVSMWNTYNISLIEELFLPGEDITYISSEKRGIIVGITAIKKHHESFGFVKDGKSTDNKLWLEDIYIRNFTGFAVVAALWFFQRGDGSSMSGPMTIVYNQLGETHKIVHMHFANT